MKLILALGNPGPRYADTRHNVGWWLADRIACSWALPRFAEQGPTSTTGMERRGQAIEIHKPLPYMNRSGEVLDAVGLGDRFEVGDMLVLVDDVSLDPGRFRLRAQGSPGGHNGLSSIEARLGDDTYARLRIGVGRPYRRDIDLAAWVLAAVPMAEEEAIMGAFPRAVEAVETWLDQGIEAAMSRFN